MDDFHKQTTQPDLQVGLSRVPLPDQIGPYKIESLLNKGGMSVLYLGNLPDSAEPLVIKVLLPKYLKNKEIANRFLKEAQIIGMTNHPNIVRLYGQGQWEKGLYIAMEFIQGISLRQFIQQTPLSPKRALEIVLQVAYALSHLHTHGVIHRDLKPENILITEKGDIKVIDFGIAQLQGEQERITQRQKLMGTPIYMSPEQKENPQQVSFSSDIYSLGIIAYELILGRLSHGVIHLSLLPKALRAILEKALKINPEERYPDIIPFISDISAYRHTLTEEKETSSEEGGDELLSAHQEARSLLWPEKPPHWPQLELGLAAQEGSSLTHLYLDFFQFSEQRYCIVLGESQISGFSSLLSSLTLRGLVRMAIETYLQNENPALPLEMVNALNRAISEDRLQPKFSFCLLFFDAIQESLSFISCSSEPIWHLSQDRQQIRTLTTPNPLLGENKEAQLLATIDNWRVGDALILPSQGISLSQKEVVDLGLLAAQPQAERLLETFLHSQKGPLEKTAAILTLQRTF